MEGISFVYFAKEGKNYNETFRAEDPVYVYKRLSEDLIAKKVNACAWIKSIKRTPLYNGFDQIIVTYDHGGRGVYTIEH